MSQQNTPAIEESSQADKANWDGPLTKAFIDICIDRQKACDRPNTHFSRKGWKSIIVAFKEKTGKNGACGRKLVLEETGLGWDPIHQTVLAENEWWERKIKEDRKCVKFRNQGIDNKEELQFLFSDQEATGLGIEDLLLSQDEDSTDLEYNANADVTVDILSSPNPLPHAGRRSISPSNRGRQKRKAINSRTSMNSVNNNGDIDDVMEILEEFLETANGGLLLRETDNSDNWDEYDFIVDAAILGAVDCIGAIANTHIPAVVPYDARVPYIGQKDGKGQPMIPEIEDDDFMTFGNESVVIANDDIIGNGIDIGEPSNFNEDFEMAVLLDMIAAKLFGL
ncbi:uncharacterized protein LOC119987918 [Tripterygium wilfordii]|uniref:uncharacterized protein LOC119987918 n=1 Tax=Tripterygium wilfordii TaxID=458696 RepID=UPI0018F82FD4|nr:uncharacterized protein LOC119987918 [Tripterygium wilfordii]